MALPVSVISARLPFGPFKAMVCLQGTFFRNYLAMPLEGAITHIRLSNELIL